MLGTSFSAVTDRKTGLPVAGRQDNQGNGLLEEWRRRRDELIYLQSIQSDKKTIQTIDYVDIIITYVKNELSAAAGTERH